MLAIPSMFGQTCIGSTYYCIPPVVKDYKQISFPNHIAWKQEFHNRLLSDGINDQAAHQESSIITVYMTINYIAIAIDINTDI